MAPRFVVSSHYVRAFVGFIAVTFDQIFADGLTYPHRYVTTIERPPCYGGSNEGDFESLGFIRCLKTPAPSVGTNAEKEGIYTSRSIATRSRCRYVAAE